LIELITNRISFRKFLKPKDKQAEFEVKAENLEAREYCNLHGLWRSK